MLGSSAEEQLAQTLTATVETIEPMALTIFGSTEELTPITKKFSLFRLQT